MILLWFVLGILLALAIARYNRSQKLFWQLALSFVLGYALTVMCTRTFSERSSDNLTQVCPTQVSVVTSGNTLCLLTDDCNMTSVKVTAFEPVSQVYTPDECEKIAIPSKVFGRTRDQPLLTITQPPECLTKVISTLRDTG